MWMPEMDGTQLAEAMRRDRRLAEIPGAFQHQVGELVQKLDGQVVGAVKSHIFQHLQRRIPPGAGHAGHNHQSHSILTSGSSRTPEVFSTSRLT